MGRLRKIAVLLGYRPKQKFLNKNAGKRSGSTKDCVWYEEAVVSTAS